MNNSQLKYLIYLHIIIYKKYCKNITLKLFKKILNLKEIFRTKKLQVNFM